MNEALTSGSTATEVDMGRGLASELEKGGFVGVYFLGYSLGGAGRLISSLCTSLTFFFKETELISASSAGRLKVSW